MTWSEVDRVGEKGHESTFVGAGFQARLVFDCHGDRRKLEVSHAHGMPTGLLEHLKPFGPLQVVWPGQLVIIDRPGYFRLHVVPNRLQALLRKAAPPEVVAELLGQLEQALAESVTVDTTGGEGVDGGEVCPDCQESLCAAGALSRAGGLQIAEATCTRCLDCIRHHVRPVHLPPVVADST